MGEKGLHPWQLHCPLLAFLETEGTVILFQELRVFSCLFVLQKL